MPRTRAPLIVAGEPLELDAPGLRLVPRSGRHDAYWVCSDRAARLGFRPRTMRLHYDLSSVESAYEMAARCRELKRQMDDWLRDPGFEHKAVFDGSLSSLIQVYQTDEMSPYHGLRQNTRKCYDEWCKVIEARYGKRRIDRLTGSDLRRWHSEIRAPKEKNGKPRDRLAYGCVRQMMRVLVNFGMSERIGACFELSEVMERTKLQLAGEQPVTLERAKPRHRIAMTFEQADAIVTEALSRGTERHRSLAIGVAVQFEFGLSQIDVIGWYEKIDRHRALPEGAVVAHGRLWRPGLRWEDFKTEVFEMARSKTAVPGIYDVLLAPLFLRAVKEVPESERVGPLVVDGHRLPLRRRFYADLFRDVATAAKVPEAVKSMHARHGAASEADDAGVEEGDIARLLQHSNPRVTRAFYMKGSLNRSRQTQRARIEHREKKGGAA